MVGSFAKVQGVDDLSVGLFVVPLEVFQQPSALTHHFQESAAGIEISLVGFEVRREVVDALCQQRNLHLGGACICFVPAKLLDRRASIYCDAHLMMWQYTPGGAARQAILVEVLRSDYMDLKNGLHRLGIGEITLLPF